MNAMRTTTGQSVTISYEPKTNTLSFIEDDWLENPIRSSALSPKTRFAEHQVGGVTAKPATDRQRRPVPTLTLPSRRQRNAGNVVHLAG